MFNNIIKMWNRHREISHTIQELNRLSNRELQDIGITRSEITGLAYRIANPKRY